MQKFDRDAWRAKIREDYPNLPIYFVELLLDTYNIEPEWFQREIGRLKREDKSKAKEPRKPAIVYTDLPGKVEVVESLPEHLLPPKADVPAVEQHDE